MGLPVVEIKAATMARLRGDTTLQGLLVGAVSPRYSIFDADSVPTNQPFPYVVVSLITGRLGSLLAFGTDATDIFLQVSVFDQNTGFDRGRGIAKQVYADISTRALTLTGGFTNVLALLNDYREIPEKDGLTQQIAQRFTLQNQG